MLRRILVTSTWKRKQRTACKQQDCQSSARKHCGQCCPHDTRTEPSSLAVGRYAGTHFDTPGANVATVMALATGMHSTSLTMKTEARWRRQSGKLHSLPSKWKPYGKGPSGERTMPAGICRSVSLCRRFFDAKCSAHYQYECLKPRRPRIASTDAEINCGPSSIAAAQKFKRSSYEPSRLLLNSPPTAELQLIIHY